MTNLKYTKIKQIIILATLCFSSLVSYARSWDRVTIPNAYCGDGKPYTIFVDKQASSKNLVIEFMGGGACWDRSSCGGINLKAWIHSTPEAPAFSYLTSDVWFYSNHPFADDSAVYFPYCTGDVFAGRHIADYNGLKVYHLGRRNIELALRYIKAKKLISIENIERLTVWGASAGAMGALIHLQGIEKYFPVTTKKFAIIDSPGLHFGKDFWKKFTPELQNDYKTTFSDVGLKLNLNDGFLAPNMGPVLDRLQNWKIGFLIASKDLVMSEVFGEISPEEHKKLVLSRTGLPAIVKPYPNIKMWISDSYFHTFLLLRTSATTFEDQGDADALDFVREVMDQEDRFQLFKAFKSLF